MKNLLRMILMAVLAILLHLQNVNWADFLLAFSGTIYVWADFLKDRQDEKTKNAESKNAG